LTRPPVTFTPIKVARKSDPFNLGELVDRAVGKRLQDGDVLVDLATVVPSAESLSTAEKLNIPPELAELAIRESDEVIGGVSGFMLTLKEGLLTPNAGIDKSNVDHGKVVLYPRDSLESAVGLVDAIRFRRGVQIGVVVSDSRLTPTRKGTVGVALAAVGVDAIVDLRGKPDLYGNVLKVTSQAIADDLCSGAQVVMGEANEATPIVMVRGLTRASTRIYSMSSFAVDPEQCVYMRSLGYRPR
jgi:coenzyme F420-0:L-glutamate ligase / coenzyme F420-1:gamma-L-glutamate ligase